MCCGTGFCSVNFPLRNKSKSGRAAAGVCVMVDLRKAARGRCAPSEFLATAITIRKRLCCALPTGGNVRNSDKTTQYAGAIACSSCHDLIDGRVKTIDYPKKNYAWCMQKVFFAHKKSGKGGIFMIYPTNTGKSGEHLLSPRWKVSGFRENYVCGGAGVYWRR